MNEGYRVPVGRGLESRVTETAGEQQSMYSVPNRLPSGGPTILPEPKFIHVPYSPQPLTQAELTRLAELRSLKRRSLRQCAASSDNEPQGGTAGGVGEQAGAVCDLIAFGAVGTLIGGITALIFTKVREGHKNRSRSRSR